MKMAKDSAYTLAMHLLAAQLNEAADACTTQEVKDTITEAENLLVDLGFDGTGDYLHPKGQTKDTYYYALDLGDYLDRYNNGEFCP